MSTAPGTNGHAPSFEAEQARLEAEIAATVARAERARERTREREAASRRAMREEVEATRRAIVGLESRHREALAVIEETAELEIARLRAEYATPVEADDE